MASDPAGVAARPALRSFLLAELRTVVGLIGGGLVVGLVWAALVPVVQRWSDPGEHAVAGDGGFAMIGSAAGVVTALLLARAPGRYQTLRAATVLLGAVPASAMSVVVGRLAGAPALQAYGVLLLWPLTAAVITMFRLLVSILIWPDQPARPSTRSH